MKNQFKKILYCFDFPDGEKVNVELELDAEDMSLKKEIPDNIPEWTKLDFHKCSVCRKDSSKVEYCPVALNIADVIDKFSTLISHSRVRLEIFTHERAFIKEVPVQDGLSSLVGVIMATSDCSVLEMLRPMVLTHLPFATGEETAYRAMSMYMLGQYYRRSKGLDADLDMKGLKKIYERLSELNRCFIERFRFKGGQDAHLNAIVKLSCFGEYTVSSIEDNLFVDFTKLYKPYYKDGEEK
ncbi:MAG: hypothetical protein C0601_07200 [Candidatus Muiribacterium halophilum]|uniref:Uncharacterized protein n=1 Tax=Muiribacterium halophilum TaxID=2053465 RepID=A0A2N5ZFQ4_MUIH1|nr:MAG: hypothetical protein C0601_07200 [Candidatus Muirbacterium halophilum]